jgi:subtilisin family serine protease
MGFLEVSMNRFYLGLIAVGVALVSAHGADQLKLTSRTIIWQPGLGDLTNQLNGPAGTLVPAFIHFSSPLNRSNHQVLQAAGVQLQDYLSDDSYSALFPTGSFLTNTAAVALVSSATPVLVTDKLTAIASLSPGVVMALGSNSSSVTLLIGFWRTIPSSVISSSLTNVGLSGTRHGADNSWTVAISSNPADFFTSVSNLAMLSIVRTVFLGPQPPVLLNDEGRLVATNSDVLQGFTLAGGKPNYTGLTGAGVRIAICDGAIDANHADFKDPITLASRVIHPRLTPSDHGTAVASIAGGNGRQSEFPEFSRLPYSLRGHAPLIDLLDYPPLTNNADLYFTALKDEFADVSNHSYVQSYHVYRAEAQSIDTIVHGTAVSSAGATIPSRPAVWAAGNNGLVVQDHDPLSSGFGQRGYYSVFTTAKNTISVGSVDTQTKRRSPFSSMGPTYDGRIKPDVVAPGSHTAPPFLDGIIAAMFNTQSYADFRGTSMAAPVVSGIIAMMRQRYLATGPVPWPELQPALYKAVLIQTATDGVKLADETFPEDLTAANTNPDTGAPTSYDEGPDFATGFGLVNAELACAKIGQTQEWGQGTILETGAMQEWCFDVPQGNMAEIKVVIAWDDLPGPDLTDDTVSRLVNDLDLVLVDPNGGEHRPWTINPPPNPSPLNSPLPETFPPGAITPATRGPDHLNNVEMVTVPAALAIAGTWHVKVTGFRLPFPEPQLYSLVSSFPVVSPCGVAQVAPGLPDRQVVMGSTQANANGRGPL